MKRLLQWLRRTGWNEYDIRKQYESYMLAEMAERFQDRQDDPVIPYSAEEFAEALDKAGVILVDPMDEEKMKTLSPSAIRQIRQVSQIRPFRYTIYTILPDRNDLSKYHFVTNMSKEELLRCRFRFLIPELDIDFFFYQTPMNPQRKIDFLAHVHEYFEKWDREKRLLDHEIPKRKKILEMQMLKSKTLGIRKIETSIELRYSGQSRIENDRVKVDVPLCNGHGLSIDLPARYDSPNWGDSAVELLTSIIDYVYCKAESGTEDMDKIQGSAYFGTRRRCMFEPRRHIPFWEDFPEKDRKRWRKWMPIYINIT